MITITKCLQSTYLGVFGVQQCSLKNPDAIHSRRHNVPITVAKCTHDNISCFMMASYFNWAFQILFLISSERSARVS